MIVGISAESACPEYTPVYPFPELQQPDMKERALPPERPTANCKAAGFGKRLFEAVFDCRADVETIHSIRQSQEYRLMKATRKRHAS